MDKNTNKEHEIRFYIPGNHLKNWQKKLSQLANHGRFYELTIMYDSPNPQHTFYSPRIDGRLRLRIGTPTTKTQSKKMGYGFISWKQRIPSLSHKLVRHENEIEFDFDPKQINAVKMILEDVLKCPKISSYERYRTHYSMKNVQVTIDEFPFGLVLEIESKKGNMTNEKELIAAATLFDLSPEQSSRLSCDDMYHALCKKANIQPQPHILFNDRNMPQLPL